MYVCMYVCIYICVIIIIIIKTFIRKRNGNIKALSNAQNTPLKEIKCICKCIIMFMYKYIFHLYYTLFLLNYLLQGQLFI